MKIIITIASTKISSTRKRAPRVKRHLFSTRATARDENNPDISFIRGETQDPPKSFSVRWVKLTSYHDGTTRWHYFDNLALTKVVDLSLLRASRDRHFHIWLGSQIGSWLEARLWWTLAKVGVCVVDDIVVFSRGLSPPGRNSPSRSGYFQLEITADNYKGIYLVRLPLKIVFPGLSGWARSKRVEKRWRLTLGKGNFFGPYPLLLWTLPDVAISSLFLRLLRAPNSNHHPTIFTLVSLTLCS